MTGISAAGQDIVKRLPEALKKTDNMKRRLRSCYDESTKALHDKLEDAADLSRCFPGSTARKSAQARGTLHASCCALKFCGNGVTPRCLCVFFVALAESRSPPRHPRNRPASEGGLHRKTPTRTKGMRL